MSVRTQWGVKIAMRDGVQLNATLYRPRQATAPGPAIFTLTPYIGESYHDTALYFARAGFSFLTVDTRGRGDSEGSFQPCSNEGCDGFDIVEWLAAQPYCNGQVAMWGGSYAGTNQWATAAMRPAHLATIVPAASAYLGLNFPMRRNIFWPYVMQWLTLTFGRASQRKIFDDHQFWAETFAGWFRSGLPFEQLDEVVGHESKLFHDWIAHPKVDAYWEAYNPTSSQLAALSLPILTITGIYDNAQHGALEHYRRHLENASSKSRARHYLIIGPWDHAGTRLPQRQFGGLTFGEPSLVDLQQLHVEWYAWTMQAGPKPAFLEKRVAYYVTGADAWRYADTLEQVTEGRLPLYLSSGGNAGQMSGDGTMATEPKSSWPDQYRYDPKDTAIGEWEASRSYAPCTRPNFPVDDLTDQSAIHAREGQHLVYHSAPFDRDIEVSGFFKFTAWISIDTPDTDLSVSIFELDQGGESVLLTWDAMRARYRESLREEALVCTTDALRYDFTDFSFTSRLVRRGSRIRLVIGPLNSIYFQKNYNSGGVVSKESMADARPVTVKLFHDASHPSVLYIPLGSHDRVVS